jgi:hypothetical protein
MGIETCTSSGHLNKLQPANATTISKVWHLKINNIIENYSDLSDFFCLLYFPVLNVLI